MNLRKTIVVAIIAWLIIPVCVFAGDDAPRGIGAAGAKLNSMKTSVGLSSDVSSFTEDILKGGFYILGTVFLILTIYGGFVWIKAAGRDEEVTRAKKIIATSVIGLMILLSSYAITTFVLLRLGTGGGSGGGNDCMSKGGSCAYSSANPSNPCAEEETLDASLDCTAADVTPGEIHKCCMP
ncbi:MAG: hypothetical protein NTW66_01400 [Candidatus Magasanikbacteria bacterium]|nr:hypothetical protein [Candidatus Magasanikbacteria bacterium]